MQNSLRNSLFPLRLFLLYALFVGIVPTIECWNNFGNMEAMEECWDSDLVFSVLVAVPLVTASWAAFRNFKKVPVLAVIILIFTVPYLYFTGVSCFGGLLGEPYSDPGLSADAFGFYTTIFSLCSIPFAVAFVIWFFWPRKARGAPLPSVA